jgi:hypothetical protein
VRKPRRRAPGIALVAVVALLASLAVATMVIGKSSRRVVLDPRGDGGAFTPHTHPKVCDVVKATSELAKHGHLRHSVTVRGRIDPSTNAPPVVITDHRVSGSTIGLASFILSPGEPSVWSHLRHHHKTIVYFTKRKVIKDAVNRRDKYFWIVDQCPIRDDRAPNNHSATQRLRNR